MILFSYIQSIKVDTITQTVTHTALQTATGIATKLPSLMKGEFFEIVAKHSGKCMTLGGGDNIVQSKCNGRNLQKWKMMYTHENTVILMNARLGGVATTKTHSRRPGINCHLLKLHGGHNQQWKLSVNDEGYYTITSVWSNYVLNVHKAFKIDKVTIYLWTPNGGDNQLFEFRATTFK
jgi:hypothetical protein